MLYSNAQQVPGDFSQDQVDALVYTGRWSLADYLAWLGRRDKQRRVGGPGGGRPSPGPGARTTGRPAESTPPLSWPGSWTWNTPRSAARTPWPAGTRSRGPATCARSAGTWRTTPAPAVSCAGSATRGWRRPIATRIPTGI